MPINESMCMFGSSRDKEEENMRCCLTTYSLRLGMESTNQIPYYCHTNNGEEMEINFESSNNLKKERLKSILVHIL